MIWEDAASLSKLLNDRMTSQDTWLRTSDRRSSKWHVYHTRECTTTSISWLSLLASQLAS